MPFLAHLTIYMKNSIMACNCKKSVQRSTGVKQVVKHSNPTVRKTAPKRVANSSVRRVVVRRPL